MVGVLDSLNAGDGGGADAFRRDRKWCRMQTRDRS